MVARHLKSFEKFLVRQMKVGISTAYGLRTSGHKENVVYAFGRIIHVGVDVGTISPRYYYHGWQEEPTSIDYNLVINPTLVQKLKQTEFNSLILRTRKDHSVRGKVGDISWYSQVDEKGNVEVNLSAPYPTKWVEDIPEYDRGYRDTFYFEDLNRALRYLRKNVLADEHTVIWIDLPVMNPPEERGRYEIGTATGYIQHPNGKLIEFEFGTSASTRFPNDRSFSIYIRGNRNVKLTSAESKTLFAPHVLGHEPITASDGIQVRSSSSLVYPIQVSGPFEALEKYKSKR